jgi:very-short-patch-repair endonuclease
METSISVHMRRLGGVAHIQDLLAHGYTRRQVAAMKNQGELIRPRIGWYVSPDSTDDLIRAVRVGGMLGCRSAAATYGLPTQSDRTLHVALEPNSSRLRSSRNAGDHPPAGTERGVMLHWRDRRVRHERFRVGPLDALMQVVECSSVEWAVAAIDAARLPRWDGRPLIDDRELALLGEWGGERARRAVDLSVFGAESVVETFARLRLGDIVDDVQVQYPVGRYRADIVLDGWLVIECDGAQHGDVSQFAHDRTRDAAFSALGFRVLRFTYAQIMHGWDTAVLPAIKRALADAPVHGSGSSTRHAE